MNLLILLVFLGSCGLALAHGGEDHSAPAAAPAAINTGLQRTAYGQTSTFELTLSFAPPAPGKPASFMVYLADYASNAPINEAQVELEFMSSPPVKLVAEATGRPGEYHALGLLAPGRVPVIATLQAGQAFDLLEVAEVDLSPPPAPPPEAHEDEAPRWPWLLAGGGGLLVGLLLGLSLRRRAIPLILLVILPHRLEAHGGEDHGEAAVPLATRTPDGSLHLSKPTQFLLGIRSEIVNEIKLQQRIETLGRVQPRSGGMAVVHAPQAGRLVLADKLPTLGEPVRAGQVLLYLEQVLPAAESGQMQAERVRTRAGIGEARARLAQARRELERLQAMKGLVAARELEQAELAVSLARRETERSRGEAEIFGSALGRLPIVAPLDGLIAQIQVTVGAYVTPEQPLFTVLDAQTLWVQAEVFAAEVDRVVLGGKAQIRIEGSAEPVTGTISQLGLMAAPGTRMVPIIVVVDNVAGRLRPGQIAEVALDAGPVISGLAVPDTAVVEEGGRRFVFVRSGPEHFVRRELRLGPGDGTHWVVELGLQAQERVVVAGSHILRTMR